MQALICRITLIKQRWGCLAVNKDNPIFCEVQRDSVGSANQRTSISMEF